ncbi:MAG: sugar transferase [Phycisphaerae bacterium]|nr:sugar transferase [Phycisphaerae bacterium]|tara:strand:+ start:22 stop:612 length:591 start_codon:yes stop_codon:yes gene_type:complete
MKRFLDLVFSMILLLLLSPILVIVAIGVRLTMGSPVLFRQTRPGKHGHPFELLKFRTMSNATDADGAALPDDQRLGRFGSFLRRSSLDELPELINVIRGEMSLVGPRPLLMEYLPLYNAHQARRHDIRPGITGWAQVKGRNSLGWREKFDLDVWYVDNQSFWLDLRILWMTIGQVFKTSEVNQAGQATMTKFTGNE